MNPWFRKKWSIRLIYYSRSSSSRTHESDPINILQKIKSMLTITPKELNSLLEKTPEKIELIDVRWTGEYDEIHIPQARNIPLHILPIRMNELDTRKQIIFICRSGARSGQACQFVMKSNITSYNLVWGMNSFEEEFPKKVIHGEKKKLFGIF